MNGTAYSDSFFDDQQNGALRSARVVVPLLLEYWRPSSVIDVGCGRGAWLKVFEEHGVRTLFGVDGAYVDREKFMVGRDRFGVVDLDAPFQLSERYDLAVCLEVAEHLSPRMAPALVEQLSAIAPVVLFSAAVPGQGGNDHVNEMPPAYWRRLFARHRFVLLDPIRPRILSDRRVEIWYRQNIVMYAAESFVRGSRVLQEASVPADAPAMEWVAAYIVEQRQRPRELVKQLHASIREALWRRCTRSTAFK